MTHDLVVLFEHPEWQKPLFAALESRGVRFGKYDLKQGAFDPASCPTSPSTSIRPAPVRMYAATPEPCLRSGAHALARTWRRTGIERYSRFLARAERVRTGGAHASSGDCTSASLAFNDVDTALARWGDRWPASSNRNRAGAEPACISSSPPRNSSVFSAIAGPLVPDNLLLLQEYFPVDPSEVSCGWSSSAVSCCTPCE